MFEPHLRYCVVFLSKTLFFLLGTSSTQEMGAQWLSGRVLDSRPRGCGFKSQRHHCVVSLSKTHLSWLSTGSTQEDQA